MELTGRLVRDAEVKKLTDKRELVSFTVVVNDHYTTKSGEKQELSEYFNCSYWLTTKIAEHMLKGSIVTVTGRIYLNEYKGKDGNQYANIALHANAIKIVATPKSGNTTTTAEKPNQPNGGTPETTDDLPF